jgi:hypothetical protein
MTYEEAYRKCKTAEEIMKMANEDMALAAVLNPDRIAVVRKMAEKVLNEKFPDYKPR